MNYRNVIYYTFIGFCFFAAACKTAPNQPTPDAPQENGLSPASTMHQEFVVNAGNSSESPKIQPVDVTLHIDHGVDAVPVRATVEKIALDAKLEPVQFAGPLKLVGEWPAIRVEIPEKPLVMRIEGWPEKLPSVKIDNASVGPGSEIPAAPSKPSAIKDAPKIEENQNKTVTTEPRKARLCLILMVLISAGAIGGWLRGQLQWGFVEAEILDLNLANKKLERLLKEVEPKESNAYSIWTNAELHWMDLRKMASTSSHASNAGSPAVAAARHEADQKLNDYKRLADSVLDTKDELDRNNSAIRSRKRLLNVQPAFAGIVAALMVPGVLFLFPGNYLKAAAFDDFHLVGFGSLCLIAAAIGHSFIFIILNRAQDLIANQNTFGGFTRRKKPFTQPASRPPI